MPSFSLRTPARNTKAFTLLELVVALVILGLLAAIAIPTFRTVIKNSQDRTTEASLASIGRDAQALARISPERDEFTDAHAVTAITEASWKALARGAKVSPGTASHTLTEANAGLALATLSPSGNCVVALVTPMQVRTQVLDGDSCEPGDASELDPEVVFPDPDGGNGDGGAAGNDGATLPGTLSVRPSSTDDSVILAWRPVANVKSYTVELRNDDLGFVQSREVLASDAQPDGGSVLSRADFTGLEPGTEYAYTVTPASPGPAGVSGSWTTIPEVPRDVLASVGNGRATVMWAPSKGAVGYYVYRQGAEGDVLVATVVDASVAEGFTVRAGSGARFVVKAYNRAGTSAASAPSEVFNPYQVPRLNDPVITRDAGETRSRVELNWLAGDSDASYQLLRSLNSDMRAAETVYSGPDTTAADPASLAPGTTYYYQVLGRADGVTLRSEVRSALTIPATPAGLTATVAGGTATLTWAASTGASSYNVYRDNGTLVRVVPGGTTSASFPIASGTTTSFTIEAANASGTSERSLPANAYNPGGAPTLTPATTSVAVAWAPIEGATGYILSLRYSDMVVERPVTGTSYTLSGLNPGVKVVASVRSDKAGAPRSGEASTMTLPATGSSVALSNPTISSLDASWSPVSGAGSYLLQYRKTDPAGGETAWSTIEVNSLTWTLSELSWTTEYQVRVAGVNEGGTGAYGPVARMSTATPPPVDVNDPYYDPDADSWAPVVTGISGANLADLQADPKAEKIWPENTFVPGRTFMRQVFSVPATGYYTPVWDADDNTSTLRGGRDSGADPTVAGNLVDYTGTIDGEMVRSGDPVKLDKGLHVVMIEVTNVTLVAGGLNPGALVLTILDSRDNPVTRSDSSWRAKTGERRHFSEINYMTRFSNPRSAQTTGNASSAQRWATPLMMEPYSSSTKRTHPYATVDMSFFFSAESYAAGSHGNARILTSHDVTTASDGTYLTTGGRFTEYRTVFNGGVASGATVTYYCDDRCTVWFNGSEVTGAKLVGPVVGGRQMRQVVLPAGKAYSVLAISVENGGTSANPSAVVATVRTSAGGTVIRNTDPGSWQVNRPHLGDARSTAAFSYDDRYYPLDTDPIQN